jgi:hypothetical protein
MLAVFPLRLLTGNAARPQNGSASTGKLIQSIVRCGNRSNGCRSRLWLGDGSMPSLDTVLKQV